MSLRKGRGPKKSTREPGSPTLERKGLNSLLDSFRASLLLQVSGFFLLILIAKWPVLHDPPVWDTAMSVFPAAITLEEYNFDLPRLLAEPSYIEAGPNVHAQSLITLITALLLRFTGGNTMFLPAVHLFHFLITALTLTAIYHYSRPILGDLVSLLSTLAILTFPLFLTQTGYMYLEMPLTFTAIMAFLAWRDRQPYQAGLWGALSCWIKPTGILVGFALTIAALLGPGQIRERCQRAVVVGIPPLSLTVLQAWLATGAVSQGEGQGVLAALQCALLEIPRYFPRVPDLAFFLGSFFVGSAVLHRRLWAGLRHPGRDDPDMDRNQFLTLNFLAVVSFLFMIYVVAPLSHGLCAGLPRYYVVILPFILMTLTYCLITLMSRKQTALVIVLIIGFFIINRNGIWYPSDVDQQGMFGNNFALTERSGAYRELARLQREAMHFLEQLPVHVPIYFGHHEDYLNRYPSMGYVKNTMGNAQSIATLSLSKLKQTWVDAPECVYVLYNYPWLGGERIQLLVSKMKATHNSETVRIFQSGENKIIVHRMRRPGSTCNGETR